MLATCKDLKVKCGFALAVITPLGDDLHIQINSVMSSSIVTGILPLVNLLFKQDV
jgi:hypothetical protein